MKVWISFHPLSTPTPTARYCRVLAQTRGVWRAWLLESEKRDSTVSLLAMLHLLSLIAHNPKLKDKKGYRWVTENAVRLVWRFVKGLWPPLFLCWLAVIASGIPCSYISHTFLHVWRGGSTVWAVKSDMRITSWRLRAEWGLSKLCCIRSDEERQTLADRTKIMSTAQNRYIIVFVVLVLTLTWNDLETKTVMFSCDSAPPRWSAFLLTAAGCHENKWCCTHCSTGNMCLQTTVSCVLKLRFFCIFLNFPRLIKHTACKDLKPFESCVCPYSRGSDGDLVVRSDKVQIQCVNWIDVRPQNVLCLGVLAAVQGVHSLYSLSGPH